MDGQYAFGNDWALIEYNEPDAVPFNIGTEDLVPYMFVGYDKRGLIMNRVYSVQGVTMQGVEVYQPAPVPGNSGGAILNRSMEVIGIATLRFGDNFEYGGFQPIATWVERRKKGTVFKRLRAFMTSMPERETIPAKFANLFRNLRSETLQGTDATGNESIPTESPDPIPNLPGITDAERQAIIDEYGGDN